MQIFKEILGALYFTAAKDQYGTSDVLLVNKIGSDGILHGIVPRREDLLSEEQTPRCVTLLGALLLGVLFALRDGVHHVIASASQRRNFIEQSDVKRKPELILESDLVG